MQLKKMIIGIGLLLNTASLTWADTPLMATATSSASPDSLFQGFLDYDQSLSDWGIQNSYGLDYDNAIPIKNEAFKNSVHDFYYGPKSVWQKQDSDILTTQIKAFVDYTESKISLERPDSEHSGTYLPNPAYTQPDNQTEETSYTQAKINALKENRNFDASGSPQYLYKPSQRAIIVKNANARLFPTHEGFYRDNKLAGEGAHFDYMQNSAVWAGTPVYILGHSKDLQWVFVWTRDCMGWVESERVASVGEDDNKFVKAWMEYVNEGLSALINSNVPIYTEQDHDHPWEQGYVGMIFPLKDHRDKLTFAVPVKGKDGLAEIHFGTLEKRDIVRIPYSPTPRHFVELIRSQLGRIYTWGGGRPYGSSDEVFYNDASSEMENLMVPFGRKIPRNSNGQVSEVEASGKVTDLTKLTPKDRIDFVQKNARPFMTIMAPGAINNTTGAWSSSTGTCLYLGNYVNPEAASAGQVPLYYCNAYGLPSATYRAVIKHSGILPLTDIIPEDTNLLPLTSRPGFKLINLDEEADMKSPA